MNSLRNQVHDGGLRFFGRINASIAHEIRNVLAVINEDAGLIKDLVMMSERGMPLDPARILTISEKVLEQVGRADEIVDNMSRFAHSVDDLLGPVDVGECLNFVSLISGRFAAMRGVALEYDQSSDQAEIRTSPFLLENLIYLCIDFAMEAAGEGKRVDMSVKRGHDNVMIRFGGLEAIGEMPEDMSSFRGERALKEALGAGIEADVPQGVLILTLPVEIEKVNYFKEEEP